MNATPDRVYRWMAWKSAQILGDRVMAQVNRAAKRGSRGTTIPLEDLRALLALIEPTNKPDWEIHHD